LIITSLACATALAAPNIAEPTVNPVIERGYRQMSSRRSARAGFQCGCVPVRRIRPAEHPAFRIFRREEQVPPQAQSYG
jgi:hypothetical protein